MLQTDLTYNISHEGDAFITSQINKSISFYLNFCFILLALNILFFLAKVSVITIESIFVFFLLFALLLFFHLIAFKKAMNVHQHTVKKLDAAGEHIILTCYSTYHSAEKKRSLRLDKCNLASCDKKIFGVEKIFSIISNDLPKEEFFLLSDYWENWDDLIRIFEHE